MLSARPVLIKTLLQAVEVSESPLHNPSTAAEHTINTRSERGEGRKTIKERGKYQRIAMGEEWRWKNGKNK